MDFITIFLRTSREHDSNIVIVGRLTNVAYFIPMKIMYTTSGLAQVFIRDVVLLHGVSWKIVPDEDTNFTMRFWKRLLGNLGIELAFNTNYNLQTDGQTESQYDSTGHVEDVCNASTMKVGGVPSFG